MRIHYIEMEEYKMTNESWTKEILGIKTMQGLIKAEDHILEKIRLLDNTISAYEQQKEIGERNGIDPHYEVKKIAELLNERSDVVYLLSVVYEHAGMVECGIRFE